MPYPTHEYDHTGRYGTTLIAPRRDLSKGLVKVYRPKGLSGSHFAQDMMEIMGDWMNHIFPTIASFQGFDCIQISVTVGYPPKTEA